MELGSVVYSKAGRDSGDYFCVVELVDENYVKIADGDKRRLAKAKLKKVKHLKETGSVLSRIADKLSNNVLVFDAELKSALRPFKNEKRI